EVALRLERGQHVVRVGRGSINRAGGRFFEQGIKRQGKPFELPQRGDCIQLLHYFLSKRNRLEALFQKRNPGRQKFQLLQMGATLIYQGVTPPPNFFSVEGGQRSLDVVRTLLQPFQKQMSGGQAGGIAIAYPV